MTLEQCKDYYAMAKKEDFADEVLLELGVDLDTYDLEACDERTFFWEKFQSWNCLLLRWEDKKADKDHVWDNPEIDGLMKGFKKALNSWLKFLHEWNDNKRVDYFIRKGNKGHTKLDDLIEYAKVTDIIFNIGMSSLDSVEEKQVV